MKIQSKDISKSQKELTITVQPEEYQKHLERAAKDISENVEIKGFRPGHAPYDQIKAKVGEMKIYEQALEYMVRNSYEQALKDENIDPVGMPNIEVEKLAPGNELVYKATISLLPSVELPDFEKINVEKKEKEIKDEDLDRVFKDIQGMRATEVLKDGPAGEQDKIIVDMDMLHENVPLDGGQAKDHAVYLNEDYYVPGLQKELIGLKKGDDKSFKLKMPKDHYQKHMAGKDVEYKVKVKEVYERSLPEINDELAKTLGQESVEKMRELIAENLAGEEKKKADQRYEVELLDTVVAGSKIGEIPEVLIDAEKDKMLFELKAGVEKQGMEWSKYMENIGKSEEKLIDGFTDQAIKRAQAALVSRQIAKENGLEPDFNEIEKELEVMREHYKEDAQAISNLARPEIRHTVATLIRNRKTMVWLKENTKEKKTA